MRKVMVVDDEKWIRRGLIQSIDWDRFGLELVGEAADGQEAYTKALVHHPELLFLDMRMPGLDGRQLLAMLDRDLPQTLKIVVSGYSDFEYAKEAIRHKAFDYLLKPVKKEELAAVIEKALAELDHLEKEKWKASGGSEWLARLLLNSGDRNLGNTVESFLPYQWQYGEYHVIVCRPDLLSQTPNTPDLHKLTRERLNQSLPFLFSGQWSYELATAPDDENVTVIALCGKRIENKELMKLLCMLQAALKNTLSEIYKNVGGCQVPGFSFGVSSHKAEPVKLAEAYQEARRALLSKKLSETNALLFFSNTRKAAAGIYPQEKESTLLLKLQTGNKEAALQGFEDWLLAFCNTSTTVEQMQYNATVLIHAIGKQILGKEGRLEDVFGRTASEYSALITHHYEVASMKKLFTEELLPAVTAYYSRFSEKYSEIKIAELKKLIESEYNKQISLQQIANHYYMNSDYIGRLFKKITGKNFGDYLTDVRITKAKELMSMSAYKNYEIAKLVGYEDYRYFSQIFKKKVGMTIGEYRNQLETNAKQEERN